MIIEGVPKSDFTNDSVDSVVIKIMSSLFGNCILLISESYVICVMTL